MPEPPFRAALLAPTWLGDAVMSTALLPLAREISGRKVQVWARPGHRALFETHPAVASVLDYDPKGEHARLRGLVRWRRRLRGLPDPPDLVWLIPDSFSAALGAWFGGVRCRVGRRGQGRDWLLTRRLKLSGGRERHWIEQQAELTASAAPRGMAPADLVPRIEVGDDAAAAAAEILAERGLAPDDCCAFVAGATYGPAKRWPHFAELAECLPPSLTVLLVGTSADKPVLSPLGESLARVGRSFHDLSERMDLPTLAALLRALRFTVANDTGPMHLAAASGGRVLGLFASTSPAWTAPRGPQARFLTAGTDCSPCFRRDCPLPDTVCMAELGAERVLSALADWLPKAGSP